MSGPPAAETPPLLTAYLGAMTAFGPGVDPAALSLAIHPHDEMLAVLSRLCGGDREQGLIAYFDSGRRIFTAYDQIVRWRFGSWASVGRLLDFASGYGRVTRFLAGKLPRERVTIAEILPEAVRFQGEAFGVHAVLSDSRPEKLPIAGPFDLVLVTSLFTHLPRATFGRWLARLGDLLSPEGLLVFSVHDVSLLPAAERPADGFHFQAVSEIDALDREEYGSAWADDAFVTAALAEVGLAGHRLPRGLCNVQDLYLASRTPFDVSGLDFRTDLEGFVENVTLTADGTLFCRGWVADFSATNPLAAIVVSLDGVDVLRRTEFGRRRDVVEAYELRLEQVYAWELEVELPGLAGLGPTVRTARFAITAEGANGSRRLLHLSSLEGALLWSAHREIEGLERAAEAARGRHAAEVARLAAQIRGMEASRFWKLRNAWFGLKRALGLSPEEVPAARTAADAPPATHPRPETPAPPGQNPG